MPLGHYYRFSLPGAGWHGQAAKPICTILQVTAVRLRPGDPLLPARPSMLARDAYPSKGVHASLDLLAIKQVDKQIKV
jgi:hypothetical protein